jgi:hypothetical protein
VRRGNDQKKLPNDLEYIHAGHGLYIMITIMIVQYKLLNLT